MSGKRSRDKGKRGEREVAHLVRSVFPDARRGWQARDGADAPDVDKCAFWYEVKRQKRCNIKAALRQAEEAVEAAGDHRAPHVWTKDDGERWIVAMDGDDYLDLVREWKERGE